MKLAILQSTLKKALSIVGKSVAGKSSLPVLANVLLTARHRGLVLTTTNLETSITVDASANVSVLGSVTLPAKLLTDWIGGLPNELVHMSLNETNQTVSLSCGRYTATMHGIEADEFPIVPEFVDANVVTFNSGELRTIIAQTVIAAAEDNTRPALAGVYISNGVFAAADGFRLARRNADGFKHLSCDVIIPAKSLSMLSSLICDDGTVDMVLSKSGTLVRFSTETMSLTTRLIDGKFPDVARIIPTIHFARAVVDSAELAAALKLSAQMLASVSKEAQVVRLAFMDTGAIISANTQEIGTSEARLDCEFVGESVAIALNVHYLADAVTACKTQKVAIEMQSPQNPAVVKPVGVDNYLHIVMPMSVR